MNKRIEELSLQCIRYKLVAEGARSDFDYKKFAELIVHQMLEITDAHTEVFQTDRDRALIEHIKKSVKQHFGVEL
jgi:hypothetical protein